MWVKKTFIFSFLILSMIQILSCDAYLRMDYVVKNQTNQNIKILVPRSFENNVQKDTLILLKNNENALIGRKTEIGFPYTTKTRIYNQSPGYCGIKLIAEKDTIKIGCSKKEWQYNKRKSIFLIK